MLKGRLVSLRPVSPSDYGFLYDLETATGDAQR